MDYQEWLAHFNPNHDPNNGQFTKSSNSIPSYNKRNILNKKYSNDQMHYNALRKKNKKHLTNEELKFIADRNRSLNDYRTEGEKRTRKVLSKIAGFAVTAAGVIGLVDAATSLIEWNTSRWKYSTPFNEIKDELI